MLPTISADTWTWNDECGALTGWTATVGALPSIVGSELVWAAGSAGQQAKKTMSVPASGDFIIYAKMRYGVAANAYNKLAFRDAAGNTVFQISLGYGFTSAKPVQKQVGATISNNSTKLVLISNFDYSAGFDVAVHVDSKYSCLSFYQRLPDGSWDFLAFGPRPSNIYSIVTVEATNSSGLQDFGLDFVSVGRPNLMAIGDSTTAGTKGFDPDDSKNLKNYASTWMKTATIYQHLRNNLIVNKGNGGDSSAQIKARVAADIVAHQPKVVFVQASTNDYHKGITSQAARSTNIQNTVTAIVTGGADVVLLNAIYARSGAANWPAEADFNRDWWNNYASTVTGVFIAIDRMVVLADGSGYIDATYCDPTDKLHQSVAGYGVDGAYVKSYE